MGNLWCRHSMQGIETFIEDFESEKVNKLVSQNQIKMSNFE